MDAEKTEKTGPRNRDRGRDPAGDPIDVPIVLPDEVPSRVQSVIEGHRADASVAMICYSPEPDAWNICRERLYFGEPPTDLSADEICVRLLSIARDAFVGFDEKSAPTNWRIRLRIRVGKDGHTYRHAPFRIRRVDDKIVFLDVGEEPGSTGTGAYQALREQLEAQGDLMLRSLTCVAKQAENFVRMGETVQKIAEGNARMSEASAAGLATVIQARAQVRDRELSHQEEMARQERWDGLVDKIATPFALELADFMRDVLREARGKRPTGSLCEELRGLRERAGDRWPRFLACFTEDERSVFDAMLREEDDKAALEQYRTLRSLLQDRLEQFAAQASEVLGPLARDFLAWVARCDARAD